VLDPEDRIVAEVDRHLNASPEQVLGRRNCNFRRLSPPTSWCGTACVINSRTTTKSHRTSRHSFHFHDPPPSGCTRLAHKSYLSGGPAAVRLIVTDAGTRLLAVRQRHGLN